MKKHILTLALISMTFWAQASERLRWTSPENYRLSADLYPAGPRAVVVIHGTGGVDQRGSMYAEALNQAGITALVVDFKSGIYTNAHDRGRHRFIPMLRSAIDQLNQKGYARIGVMGTSLGGVITIHAKLKSSGVKASSYVALYPNCGMFLPGGQWPTATEQAVESGPIMIMWGDQDDLPDRTECPRLEQRTGHWSAEYRGYPNARHGFDRQAPRTTVSDPTSPTGQLTLEYNEQATRDAVPRIVKFFQQTL
jgi:dienelactone hydrolase